VSADRAGVASRRELLGTLGAAGPGRKSLNCKFRFRCVSATLVTSQKTCDKAIYS
jgi:hypothetical protein